MEKLHRSYRPAPVFPSESDRQFRSHGRLSNWPRQMGSDGHREGVMGLSEEIPFSRLLPMAGTKPSLRPFLLLLIAAAWSSCGSPTRPTSSSSSSSPTGVYVTPGGPTVSTTLSRIGDTFQLSAFQVS